MHSFENIKVGDVFYATRSTTGNRRMIRLVVDRVTPKQFHAGAFSFHKKNGYLVGGGKWSSTTAIPSVPVSDSAFAAQQSEIAARKKIQTAIGILQSARGAEAIRLCELLPDELKG